MRGAIPKESAGERWSFQVHYRDGEAGRFTNAVEIRFK